MIYPSYYPQNGYNGQCTANNAYSQNNAHFGANTGIIWVQGEAGAKSFLVQPGNTVQLWDSESQTIYLKSADSSGMPSMKIIDYTIREQPGVSAPVSSPTREEIEGLRKEIAAIRARIDELTKGEEE